MDKQTMRALIAQELDRIPRGDTPQNVFRSLYQGLRESDLARDESGVLPSETFQKSVLWVQKIYPKFHPTVDDPHYFQLDKKDP